ncbi:lipopolysaccharide core heptose(II) kinase RfaY [Lactobacillus sp. R2/2]|nr:lipopolysaccharide core heptose(II) kinase RfaY [Lactobacillus sp. R2/2]
MLNNEIKYMKVLNKSPYIPELIETFSQGKTLVEIMRFISGPQLINIKIEDKEKVIRSLIKTVYSLHKQGIIIGDLTNTNFIYSNQKCYLVDLEYMASVNTPQKREAQTRFYLPDYKKKVTKHK